jgi:hypothetical protein
VSSPWFGPEEGGRDDGNAEADEPSSEARDTGGTLEGNRDDASVAVGSSGGYGDGITEYEQERGGVTTFEGHGVMTYDSNEARYVLHWFDSMGSPPEVFTGTFEGDVLTVGHGGPGMHARLTYDLTRKGVLRSRMDLSEDGADWAGFFECDYERDS